MTDVIAERKNPLTPEDQLLKELGVEDGTRAQHIYEELNQLPDNQAKAKRWDELVARKVITAKVAEQLRELITPKP